MAEVKQKVA